MLGSLPDLAELAKLESESAVVEYVSKNQQTFAAELQITDNLLGYRLLRFVLATSRPILMPVSLSDSALTQHGAKERVKLPGSLKFHPAIEANVDQYAILTNGPAEARFRAMREKHGSSSAYFSRKVNEI